jgi:tRNA threonylcarbamoyladenosine biosynthesis protein TsaB
VIVLGIETATELVGVAVDDGEGHRASAQTVGHRRHTELLTTTLESVLASAGVSLSDLDGLIVDVGPGLFTGLRVGLATAQGLAFGLGIGVLGLTSLEVLAHVAGQAGVGQPEGREVVSIVDARRQEVFAQRFTLGAAGSGPFALDRARALTPEVLATELAALERPLQLVGDGATRYAERFAALADVVVAGPPLDAPLPEALVDLGLRRLAAGAELTGPATLEPLYLREADARINWSQRQPAR